METILTNDNIEIFKPKAALIVFERTNCERYEQGRYLELRSIRADGSFSEAKAVPTDFIQNMLAGFSKEYRRIPHGEIPDNLLYCDTRKGMETYVWYNPPQTRTRLFDKSLGLENGKYKVPGTLYVVKNNELSVFCFKGKKPSQHDVLLGVPYFNVYQNGKVCMGSSVAVIPDTDKLSYDSILNAWESAFWNSIDTHTNGSPSTRENLIETIKKYQTIPFDTEELVPRPDKLTLNQRLSKLK